MTEIERAVRRPMVLLTGFGPFPGMPENASTRLARDVGQLAEDLFPAFAFESVALPTEWHRGPALARALYDRHEPVAAIHFGVSGRAQGFEIELRGRNRLAAIADASGHTPQAGRLDPRGPDVLTTRLPAARILALLRAHRLPAMPSWDAGGYLCNALLYQAADYGRRHASDLKTGFIHIPAGLARPSRQPKRPPAPSLLAWPDAVLGGLLIVAATLGQPLPRRLSTAF